MCHKAQSHIALIKNMGQNVTCCLHLLAFMDAWHHNNWLAKKSSSHVDLVIHNILDGINEGKPLAAQKDIQLHAHGP